MVRYKIVLVVFSDTIRMLFGCFSDHNSDHFSDHNSDAFSDSISAWVCPRDIWHHLFRARVRVADSDREASEPERIPPNPCLAIHF